MFLNHTTTIFIALDVLLVQVLSTYADNKHASVKIACSKDNLFRDTRQEYLN